MLKDVIVLAKGESRVECPFDAEENWGLNNVGNFPEFKGKRIDKLFAFDPLPLEYTQGMKTIAPIVSWQDYADIEYPLDAVVKRFNTRYFSNTISYMLAYAIFNEIPVIRLYGVDAPFGGIYQLEKSGIEYWIGRAHERGLEVIPSEGSHLLRTPTGYLYGTTHAEGNVLLFLKERLNLLNLLPRKHCYDEVVKINLVRYEFAVKADESEKHGIKMSQNSDGSITYSCDHEFATKIWLPENIWSYIIGILQEIERKGELPVDALSVYEKLVVHPLGSEIT